MIKHYLFFGVLIIILILVYSKYSKQIDLFILKKEKTVNVVLKLLLGVVTIYIAFQANNIAKEQANNNVRESAPSFEINKTDVFKEYGYEEAYLLSNKKGLASYVTFEREDTFEFSLQGYRIKLSIDNFCSEDFLNIKDRNWYYIPGIQNLEVSYINGLLEKMLLDKTNETILIFYERNYIVSFADYKNDKYTYYFDYYNDLMGIRYASNEDYYKHYSNSNIKSLTQVICVREDDDFEECLEDALNKIIFYIKNGTISS